MLPFRKLTLLLILPVVILSLTCSRHNSDEVRRGEGLFMEADREEQEFNYTRAEELYKEAASLFESNGEQSLESDVYAALGSMDHRAGNFQQAIEYYTHATELAQGAGDHARHVASLLSIAAIDSQLGQMDRALTVARQSTTLSDMFGYQHGVIEAYKALGRLQRSAGFFRQATESFSKARTAARILKKPDDDIDAALSICEIAIDEERYVDALQSLDLLLPLIDTARTAAAHRWYVDDAKAYLGIRDYSRASDAFSRALEINTSVGVQVQIQTLIAAAEAHYLLRRTGEAIQECAAARELVRYQGDRISEAMILVHTGNIERLSRGSDADASFQEAIDIFKALDYPGGTAFALHQFGKAVEAGGNFSAAVDLYRRALDVYDEALAKACDVTVEAPLRWSHLRSESSIADDLARNLILLNRPEEAFLAYERGLLDGFALTMQSIGLKPRSENLQPVYERVLQLTGELRAINRERAAETGKPDDRRDEAKVERLGGVLRIKSGEREKAIEEIEKAEPNSSFTFRVQPVRLQDIQSQIPPGVFLLEYIPAEIQLYCAIVTRGSFTVRKIQASYPGLLQRADQFKRILNTPSQPRERDFTGDELLYQSHMLGRTLYNELLGSLQIPGMNQADIVIVAPAGLSDIPFHALIGPSSLPNAEPVASRQFVRYLPFASAALFQSNQTRTMSDIVAFGNPDVTNWEVDYVLRDVKTFFKDAKLFLGPDATKSNFFSSTGDVLHIATDFLYDARYARNSYCSLWKSGGVDNVPIGSLHELFSFPCVIVMNVGPSIESVNRFHMALLLSNGSRCIIGTFWQPERGAVRAFDEQFYSSLANRMSPEASYLQAERELIAMPIFRPPHQWAPFYYFGIH